jgi:RNA polymerase sigma factor (sigma-70 family)
LRFFEGLTNPEIAEALGVSSITVAVTLHRTRRQLQKKLRTS